PGVHANAFALLLASLAADLPGPALAVGAAMLAAGVVHTFLDVVPALALGVPDPSMAASALPGHRLVLAGRGREALRLSALGSLVGALAAVPLAVPLTRAAAALAPALGRHLPVVLGCVAAYLVATESSVRAALAGVVTFALATALGAVVLDLSPAAPLPVGSILAPLFAGLFGAPVLVDAASGSGDLPAQRGTALSLPRPAMGLTAGAGALTGALVAYLPGVSAGVAATLALPAAPTSHRARGFLVAQSAANTATATFALFAFSGLGVARTGVVVALSAAGVPPLLSALVPVVALAAAAGAVLVVTVGDRYLRGVGRVDGATLAVAVLAGLAVLAGVFAGAVGVGVYLVAGVVGLVPVRLGARRVHLMGVLLGPLALSL
ncbi:MAG: tripartite tricarboxylate transporter permease, partial [Haloferacaceae archaeon]